MIDLAIILLCILTGILIVIGVVTYWPKSFTTAKPNPTAIVRGRYYGATSEADHGQTVSTGTVRS